MQYVFNYDSDTFYLDFDALKPGDQLNVLHSAASTRSLPPQSAAFEIAPYTAPVQMNCLPIPDDLARMHPPVKPRLILIY